MHTFIEWAPPKELPRRVPGGDRYSEQAVAFCAHRVRPVVAAPALPVVARCLGDNQRHLDRVAQTDRPSLSLVVRYNVRPRSTCVATHARRATGGQALRTRANVATSCVLDDLHVALDQRRIRFSAEPRSRPRPESPHSRASPSPRAPTASRCAGRRGRPDQSFKQRGGSEPVRPCRPVQPTSPTA